eukprot:6478418-Amphidinium_carterae.1
MNPTFGMRIAIVTSVALGMYLVGEENYGGQALHVPCEHSEVQTHHPKGSDGPTACEEFSHAQKSHDDQCMPKKSRRSLKQ